MVQAPWVIKQKIEVVNHFLKHRKYSSFQSLAYTVGSISGVNMIGPGPIPLIHIDGQGKVSKNPDCDLSFFLKNHSSK